MRICLPAIHSLNPLAPDKTSVGYKWVLNIKHNPNGPIARHNARLVANSDLWY